MNFFERWLLALTAMCAGLAAGDSASLIVAIIGHVTWVIGLILMITITIREARK